jgi:hypothetical protein
MTRVSVLIPTHDHAETLPITVRSVLGQTLTDIEVILIGDGVDEATRSAALDLVSGDARVRFLDFPKGPHHGETYRHEAILHSTGEVIAYLCDDDLMLPSHLAQLVTLLETHDFVQSLNGHVDTEGRLSLYPGDLSDPEFLEGICDPALGYNFVSITGTAHTREYYDRAGETWHTTPAGEFPDQHQWRRMLAAAPARGATSSQMTALQFPTHLDDRGEWSADQRRAEIQSWADRVAAPDGQEQVDALVSEASWRQLLAAGKRELRHARNVRNHALRAQSQPVWRRVLGGAWRGLRGR